MVTANEEQRCGCTWFFLIDRPRAFPGAFYLSPLENMDVWDSPREWRGSRCQDGGWEASWLAGAPGGVCHTPDSDICHPDGGPGLVGKGSWEVWQGPCIYNADAWLGILRDTRLPLVALSFSPLIMRKRKPGLAPHPPPTHRGTQVLAQEDSIWESTCYTLESLY